MTHACAATATAEETSVKFGEACTKAEAEKKQAGEKVTECRCGFLKRAKSQGEV